MRIFVTSGYGYWGNFSPEDLERGDIQIGGGETAMIQTSKFLAKLGHDVVVFYDTQRPGRFSEVDYLPTSMIIPMLCQMEHDVLLSWDLPQAFRFADRAKVHIMAIQLNSADIGVFDHAIDRYFHPSQWHVDRFAEIYPEITKSKCRPYCTNGVDPNRFIKDVERVPHRVIYSSSPDRGLHHLLRFWPAVLQVVPDAELHIFYDMDKWLALDAQAVKNGYNLITTERAGLIRESKASPPGGVTFHGGVGQARLATEQLKSSVMVYPCDPVRPTEGFSMTCLEAVSAGCTLITSNADALGELWSDAPDVTIIPLPVQDEVWVDAVVKALKRTESRPPQRVHGAYTWMGIAKRWEKEFIECLTVSV